MNTKGKSALVSVIAALLSFIPLVLYAKGLVPCGGPAPENPCTFNDFIILGDNVKNALITWIALPISGLLFAWAGFLYLTAAGDEGQVKKAHGVFQNVFFGLILALSAWLIIEFLVRTFVKGDSGAFQFI